MQLLFANVKFWPEDVEKYIVNELNTSEVVSAVECHQRLAELAQLGERLEPAGTRLCAAPAEQSASSELGSDGGAVGIAQAGVRAAPLPSPAWRQTLFAHEGH